MGNGGCDCGCGPSALGSLAAMCGPYGCADGGGIRGVVYPASVSNLQMGKIGAVLPASVSTNQLLASGAHIGMGNIGTWWSDVAAQKVRLDPSFTATDGDVQRCASALQAGEVAAWNSFLASWRAFRDDSGGWIFGSAEAYDTSLRYEQQLSAWRVQLKADGCGLTSPDLPAPLENEIPSAIKWTAAAVIAASLAYGVWALSPLRKVV